MSRRKRKETSKTRLETALKWLIYPPVLAVGLLVLGKGRKKRGKKNR